MRQNSKMSFTFPFSTGCFVSSLLSYCSCTDHMTRAKATCNIQAATHALRHLDENWMSLIRPLMKDTMTPQTFGGFFELVAAFLLPPLPRLEDLAQGGELSLTLWGRGGVPRAVCLSHHSAVVLLSFIIWKKSIYRSVFIRFVIYFWATRAFIEETEGMTHRWAGSSTRWDIGRP